MKYILLMTGTKAGVDAYRAWSEKDIQAHFGFLARLNKELTDSGEFVATAPLGPPDQAKVVRSGQVVRVKVNEVDLDRQRIALTLRLNDTPQGQGKRPERGAPAPRAGGNRGQAMRPNPGRGNNSDRRESNQSAGSMAQALRDAGFER